MERNTMYAEDDGRMTKFQAHLKSISACAEARDWAGDRTAEQAWKDCNRPDWLLWWFAKASQDQKAIVLVACEIARTALQYVKPGEERPQRAIEAAEAWCIGKATIRKVRSAAYAANAAAYAAAANAAYAACAYAAAAAVAAAALRHSKEWQQTRAAKLQEFADLVRKRLTCPWREAE